MSTFVLLGDKARCRPDALGCTVQHKCARFLAPRPSHGASVMDWSAVHKTKGTFLCDAYIGVDTLRKQAEPVQKRVHPPMGRRG